MGPLQLPVHTMYLFPPPGPKLGLHGLSVCRPKVVGGGKMAGTPLVDDKNGPVFSWLFLAKLLLNCNVSVVLVNYSSLELRATM